MASDGVIATATRTRGKAADTGYGLKQGTRDNYSCIEKKGKGRCVNEKLASFQQQTCLSKPKVLRCCAVPTTVQAALRKGVPRRIEVVIAFRCVHRTLRLQLWGPRRFPTSSKQPLNITGDRSGSQLPTTKHTSRTCGFCATARARRLSSAGPSAVTGGSLRLDLLAQINV